MNIGDLSITNFYVGDIQADKICLGAEQVWPSGEIDYSDEPLTINALDQVSLQVNSNYSGGTVYYRVKGDTTWQPLTAGQTLAIQPQAPIQLMGQSGATGLFSGGTQSGHYEVYGNVMSLVHGENFKGKTVIPSALTDTFYAMFRNCDGLVSIKNIVMPATTLSVGCYRSMFNKCWYLTELPDVFVPANAQLSSACCRYTFEQLGASASTPVVVPSGFLPATNLAGGCYDNMFSTANISTVPDLPATTLFERGYYGMFQNCSGITQPPVFSATTLAHQCCSFMFHKCTSLTASPIMRAEVLESYCYSNMFSVTKVGIVTCLATNLATSACSYWLNNAPATGTFYKAAGVTWPSGDSGIPTGWTVQDAVL